MLHGSSNPGVAGSELTRLLARLADVPPAHSRLVFAERLVHWLDWTGAISLAAALNAGPDALAAVRGAGGGADRGAGCDAGAEKADFERVRAALEASIATRPDEPASSPTEFAPYRRHCAEQQQAMQDAVGALRQRLRDALSRQSAAGARLAAIDAVLDRALAGHERSLLGLVPLRLQAQFERLQGLQRAAGDPDSRWQDIFQDDMQQLLRAELAHRLLPAQGLLDTLLTDETT